MTQLADRTPDTAAPPGTELPQSRHLATELPGPRSRALMARKASAVAAGVGTTVPVFAARAGGGIVEDVDGNRFIDLGSGIAVTTVGASHPAVVAAVQAQVEQFTHTCFMVTPYEPYVAVAERLNALTPGDHAKRTALFNSGAEAVENAVKIARHATGRDAVVVFDHAYHGRTNLTMAMTAKAMPYKSGFGPFAGEVYRAPLSYPFRDGGLSGAEAAARAIDVVEKQVGADQVACVVIEPVQGEGGFIEPAPGFLPALAAWCRENGALFVADEVQTGVGRTGDWFACDHEGVVPDLVVVAKGVAGGMPLSAVTGRAELVDAVHTGGLGGTYGGNPVACAAALAALEAVERDGLLARAREVERLVKGRLHALAARDPRVGDVRGRGAMLGVELVGEDGLTPDPALAAAVAGAAKAQGVIVLTCGTHGNVLRFLPPLSTSDELLHDAFDVLDAAFATTTTTTAAAR
ncbi:4-aminobutyrate--2-oxoglutarate transaminase [Streptomyces sp. NP160]|uniref:4-aminobutyrate--2-oxoglutarate transaminase n=1 Tax=Streptomyces sp. NP160 TaxID=2586637 RepID=UPI0027D91171|nr:4-aminobutyrate--2-oxoglutarate transaminase [Streptomyces sp. NP160]